MKRFFYFFFAFFMLTTLTQAQEEEEPRVLFSEINQVSGFGGPIFQFSTIGNDNAFFTGGGGAVLLNRRFWLGGYGMGLTSNVSFDETLELDFGHGGFWLGYIVAPDKLIHINFQSTLGWGSVSYEDELTGNEVDEDGVFVINPQAEVEVNLTRWMRFGLAGGYRFVTGSDSSFDNNELSGANAMLTLKFGWF